MIENGKLNLENLVESLLWQHDCVILPNLGALITRENQAALNPATHIFKPKSKSIFFNPSISKTDGLLANHLSENFGIGYNDAVIMIDNAISAIKNQIKNGEKVKWKSVGQFFGSDDKTFFIPKLETNFLKETYGLVPVQLTPIAQQASKTVSEEQSISAHKILEPTELSATTVEIGGEKETAIDYNKTELRPDFDKPTALPDQKPMMKYARWAVAAAIIVTLTVIGIRNENRTYVTEQKAAIDFDLMSKGEVEANTVAIPTEDWETVDDNFASTPDETISEEIGVAPTVNAVTENNQETSPTIETPVEQNIASDLKHNLTDQYHIIIEKTVLKASVDQLLDKQPSYYLPIKNSFIHRIAIASSNNIAALNEILASIKPQYPKAEIIDKVAYEKL